MSSQWEDAHPDPPCAHGLTGGRGATERCFECGASVAAASPDERLREALAGLLAADEAAAAGNPDLLFPAFDAARAALAAADREAPDEGCEPKETTDA